MTTGEKIAKLRKTNNLTQEQLAEILHVSRQSISKWESDLAFPETDKLIYMGKLFHCSVDYLLNIDHEESASIPNQEQNTTTIQVPRNRIPFTKKPNFFTAAWTGGYFVLMHILFFLPVVKMEVTGIPSMFPGTLYHTFNMYQLLFSSNYQFGNVIILMAYLMLISSLILAIVLYLNPNHNLYPKWRRIVSILEFVFWILSLVIILNAVQMGMFMILLLSGINIYALLRIEKHKCSSPQEMTE